jgi:hypothetical protein
MENGFTKGVFISHSAHQIENLSEGCVLAGVPSQIMFLEAVIDEVFGQGLVA